MHGSTGSGALPEAPAVANILLVDDHPANLLVLEAILGPLQQRLVRATSGEEALARLREEEFAVVLLDVMMPGMDGLGTADLARAQARGREVPIILMTAGDTPALAGYEHGAVDVLQKPLDRALVLAKVGVFLDLFHAREQVRRQAAQELLQRAQLETAAILAAVGDGIYGLDAQGRTTFSNAAASRILGRSSESLQGQFQHELVHPRRPDGSAYPRQECPIHRASDGSGLHQGDDEVFWREDGTSFPVEYTRTPIQGGNGLTRAVVVFRDITERRRTERARAFLAEATEALAASLDYTTTLARVARLAVPTIADSAAVYRLDGDGAIRLIVLAEADPTREALGRELDALLPLRIEQDRLLPRVVRTGRSELLSELPESLRTTWSPTTRAGQLVQELAIRSYMAVPLVVQGHVLGAVALTAYELERRFGPKDLELAEELARRAGQAIENAQLYREVQEANRAKDGFLATVSHELRTPLTAILGWVHLLRSGDPKQVARAVETIERNARAQARIVDDLLDVSRIITDKLRIEREPVQLADLVRAAVDTAQPAADAKGIALVVQLEPLAGELAGDPGRLQQVLWNLLSNAIKFTPKAGRIEVRLGSTPSNVFVSVIDTGQGIPADFLPHVFERFRQADNTPTRAHGGLGLGLAIVRHIVELHGGQVTAASEGAGRGATFKVVLPYSPVPQ